jgi:maltose/moltooligosaccharide transporter
MFANYNLICCASCILIPLLAKYTSRKFTLALVCGVGTYLYLLYPRQQRNMEWLPMIGVGIAWAVFYLFLTPCYLALCPLIKWVLYGRFQLFYSNPTVAASILGF